MDNTRKLKKIRAIFANLRFIYSSATFLFVFICNACAKISLQNFYILGTEKFFISDAKLCIFFK